MKRIVIERNNLTGWFCLRHEDGRYEETRLPITRRVGDVAKIVAKANPGAQIGCLSADFGPICTLEFGNVVWLRPDFCSA